MASSLDFTINPSPAFLNNLFATSHSAVGTINTSSKSLPVTTLSPKEDPNWCCQKIIEIWNSFALAVSDFYYWVLSHFNTFYPAINNDMSKEALNKLYWGLGKGNKWREFIDGRYHEAHGKYVFDKGLHAGTVEPGYVASMENACEFVQNFLNLKVDADWYLQLHKRTCAHFNGDRNIYLMGQEKVGVFRDSDDSIHCGLQGYYAVTTEGRREFDALDADLKKEFGNDYGLGEMVYDPQSNYTRLNYKAMSRTQIRRIFNKFLNEYHQDAKNAKTSDEKILAVAKLHQRLEWLHPVRDGTARTSTAFMNKNLTDIGLHPAILEYPHVSSSYGLAQWKRYLQDGLVKWDREKARLNPVV